MNTKKITAIAAGAAAMTSLLFGLASVAFAQDTTVSGSADTHVQVQTKGQPQTPPQGGYFRPGMMREGIQTHGGDNGSTSPRFMGRPGMMGSTTGEHGFRMGMGSTTPHGDRMSSTTRMENHMQKGMERGDKEIDIRIESLTKLEGRINEMKRVSDSDKASIASELENEISSLKTLKTKVDSDTSTSSLKDDVSSITKSFRIFALVEPKAQILAAVDRIKTITTSLTTVSGKLQTRITAAQTAGKDVTALNTALADLTAKIADAQTQATSAQSAIANLTPDNGATSTLQTNTAALKTARGFIKTAMDDIKAAGQDAKTITSTIRGFHIEANASSTTSVNENH